MLLANELAVFEPPEHGITAGDLQSLAGPILRKDTVDLTAPAEEQVEAALKADERYIAVTEGGTYRGLATTGAIMRDLLRSTIAALEAIRGPLDSQRPTTPMRQRRHDRRHRVRDRTAGDSQRDGQRSCGHPMRAFGVVSTPSSPTPSLTDPLDRRPRLTVR